MTRALVLGCGYLGERVARRWQAAGYEVSAVTRSAQRAESLRSAGLAPVIADLLQPATLARLPSSDLVLYAVGYDRASRHSRRAVYVDGLRTALAALPELPGRFVYISSTGVYGQDDGSWVDEQSPCAPKREGGQACLEAEQLLRSHAAGERAVVLRMAGLYGQNRLPRIEALRRGEPIAVAPEAYLNLVHVDDAAEAVCRAAAVARPSALYVVSDGAPATRRSYYEYLARQIGAPPPRFAPPEAESRDSGETNKRVDPRRAQRELGWAPKFADFRQGLTASLAPSENATRAANS